MRNIVQPAENSENSDDASNLSTDKNKQSNKLKGKGGMGSKPLHSGFILDRKNPILINQFNKIAKEKRISK